RRRSRCEGTGTARRWCATDFASDNKSKKIGGDRNFPARSKADRGSDSSSGGQRGGCSHVGGIREPRGGGAIAAARNEIPGCWGDRDANERRLGSLSRKADDHRPQETVRVVL